MHREKYGETKSKVSGYNMFYDVCDLHMLLGSFFSSKSVSWVSVRNEPGISTELLLLCKTDSLYCRNFFTNKGYTFYHIHSFHVLDVNIVLENLYRS